MEEKTNILVVDDEQYITRLIKRTLEDTGYVVTIAGDGNSALTVLKDREQDVILLDIRMPGLDGYQVLQRIRKSSEVPVLMLTAVHERTAIAQSLGLGADDYIQKPFLPRELVARIHAKLRRTRGELHPINKEGVQ